jgi:hypothetical protein
MNAHRANESLIRYGMFIGFKDPTIANLIEYTNHLIKVENEKPDFTFRIIRYLRETSPILDGMPRMVCAYVKADFIIEPKMLKKVLDRMPDTADRAVCAMQLIGTIMSKRNLAIKIGEYKDGGFYNQRVPEWVAYYVTQHTDFMRSIGYTDDDLLFVQFSDNGVVPHTKATARRVIKKWERKSGLNLSSLCDLAHWYGHIPKDAPMKYF